jgi:hypothetical protein
MLQRKGNYHSSTLISPMLNISSLAISNETAMLTIKFLCHPLVMSTLTISTQIIFITPINAQLLYINAPRYQYSPISMYSIPYTF